MFTEQEKYNITKTLITSEIMLPCDLLRKVATTRGHDIRRWAIASRQPKNVDDNCVCEIFSILSRDKDMCDVRWAVAKNTSIPKKCACEIFKNMSRSADKYTREEILANTSVPDECRDEIERILDSHHGDE